MLLIFFIVAALIGTLLPIFGNERWTSVSIVEAAPSTISGTVFKDFNANGTNDSEPGIADITVTLYAPDGTSLDSTTTTSNGSYTLNTATDGPYRIEFTGLPSYLAPSVVGTDSASTVQFVPDGNSTDIDLALHNPAEYCEANPNYGVPCYVNGDPTHASNIGEPAVAQFEYADRTGLSANTKNAELNMEDVGSLWGMAYESSQANLYMSALLKRHVGIGPSGIGAIYVQTDVSDANTVSLFYDFGAAAGVIDDNATRFPGAGNAFGEEGPCQACDNVDPDTFPLVGTAGFGDIDLAEDGSELHVVNLFDRKVYAIDLPDGNGHTELANAPWTTGDICGGTGVARPWGLKNYNGETYVGLVCDGTTSTCSAAGGACSDLTAHVYAHDGSSWRSVTSFALDYQRSLYNATASSYWHKWASDYSTIKSYIDNQTDAQYPQPLLSDIEFDDDGSMILGFMDRSSLQFGYAAPDPTDTADQISERYFSAGDILRVGFDNSGTAANHSTTYQLENNGTVYAADGTLLTGSSTNSPAGPGGREFYADEWTGIGAGNKSDSGIGSLALKPGTNEVMMIASDAFAYYGAGVMIHNSADGSFSGGVQVYSSDYNATDGLPAKAGGLGDLELFCEAASLEIGNHVWEDADGDGIQDAGESGISGVTVELYTSGGTFVASAVTDANGNYIFNDDNVTGGLTPNSDYELRLSATQPNLLPYAGPSPANVGGASDINDQSETSNLSDSNGTLSGTTVIASITTGRSGQNNHTYDFGFTTTSLSLGDLVWGDTDNDGIFDGGESGISGVTVELYRRGQTAEVGTPVMTTTTNGDGRYLFTDISQGQYFVHIPSSNFIGGGPLNGQFSSTPTEPNPDSDINEDNLLGGSGDDNGINDALPGTYGTSSGIVTLSDDGEPTGEDVDAIDSGTDDNDSNLSVDFGFNTTAPPTVELGDRIWHDANNDGIFNVGESGLSGVEVELYRDGQVPGTDTPVRTTTTDGNGNYIFSFLNPDSYFVFIPASEFGSSEPLEGMLSTMPTETNPNSDENDEGSGSGGGSGDDNGLNDSDPATNGIRTGIIVLAEGTEPTSEDVSTEQQISNDNDSNLTLDLGFFTPVSIGNYVWEDLNMDGIQNEGPAYDLSGRTVELFLADGFTPATDVNGNTVSATLTDGNGEYLFSNLPPGEYVVRVDLPTGFTPSPGGDDVDSNDSNSDSNGIASGDSHAVSLPVTLTSGGEPITDGDSDSSSNLSVDFGLIPTPDTIVTKTVSPADPVSGGETVEYTIEILNTGYTTLTNVIVSDTLPSGLTHVGGSTTVIYWDGAGNGAGGGGGDTSYFVQDDFSSVAYNNNTGGATGSWASDWIETNDDGSPVGGANFGGDAIFVATSGIWGYQFCTNANADNCLEFDLITTAAGNGARIERAIDLSSASAVTITYDHAGNSTGDVYFETFPDANGNANWVTQETHASGSSKTIVITDPDQLAANAAVRFRINNDSGDDFTVDNFQIDWVEPGVSPPAGYTSVTGGNPPNLTSSSTYTIPVGKYITVTYQATVDSPIAGGTFQFLNEVSVDSTQMDPVTDTATLPANGAADFGDLPNGYGTLSASSGASHTLDGTTFLGSSVDGESDGVPGNQANGDDSASSPDDEDGVVFVTPIQPNRTFTIEVTAGGDGVLNAWIDYNADGTLTQIVNEQSLTQGVHTLSFTAPANTTVDDTIYSRFRFSASTGQVTGPSGAAASGEVEDYALLAIGDTVWIDLDADGTQDGGSEVGIAGVVVNLLDQFGQPVTDGAGTPITTTTDVSGNYGFAGLSTGDYIVELDASNWTSGNVFGTGGTYAGAVGTPTQGGDDGTNTDDNGNNDLGGAGTGIQSGVISLALGTEPTTDGDSDSNTDLSVDFGLFQPNEYGDLPDIYGTTLANNGAAHVNDGSTFLGSTIDQEGDGTPTDDAEGDDDATGDDEDGITFLTPLIPGEPAVIEVEAGSNGFLHAWIDFDADGTLDPVNLSAVNGSPTGGSINDLSLTTGTYTLTIIVPATTTITNTIYSRFRYTANDTAGTLGSTGIWPNGEVEDYALMGLGDVVWFDVDNGGDQDVAELRLENIVLNLLDGSGDPLTDGDGDPIQTTTDSNGNYYFGGLPEGSYIVELDYSNWEVGGLFGPGGLYAGAVGSSGSGGDDGDNTDDNGDKDGQTVTITNTIRSGVVALDLGTESTTDGDSNANTDFTIDFGIFLQQYDYGDLPNSYGTTLAESGARHLQTSITYLGSGVDAELDGNPTVDATGDDTYTITVATGDDEDGIIFSPLSPGQTAIVTVTAGTGGYLNGWIDFDADGTLDPISIVSGPGAGGALSDLNLTAGVYVLEISVPATMTVDSTIYSRFRFTANSGEVTGPTGTANSGEVEDYALSAIGNTVWYDRNNDGTQDVGEVGIPNVVMNLLDGSGDPVLDGSGSPLQTTTDANGNYGFAGLPDGDYIVQIDPSNWNGGNVFGSGGPYEGASNVAGAGGGDNADDQDNTDDNGDNDGVVGPAGGVRSGVISIGLNSEPTGDGDNDPNTDLTIDFGFFYTSYDYGDLPEGAYNTTDGNSGANHLIVGDIYLGNGVDADGDGQPSDAATNDDSDGNDDEDGVLFFTPLHPGRSAEIRVYANADGYLSSFIDFDADGTLDNVTYTSLDAVITPTTSLNNTFLTAGWHTFFIDVPANTVISDTIYSRFRFTGTSSQATTATGSASSGEVEDYPLGSIGNRVWADVNNNGTQEGGEAGISGVIMELWGVRDADGYYITTTTDINGNYYFGGLPEGDYTVQVHEDNWLAGGVFGSGGSYDGWVGSTGQGGDDRVDTDDNGNNDGGQNPAGDPSVYSNPMTLTLGTEVSSYTTFTPTVDTDFKDFTIDFGFSELIDLGVDKSINDLTPTVGDTITFTIAITNAGPSTATGVEITDTLPSGYTFSSASATEGSYDNLTGVWSTLTLTATERQTLTIAATVNATGVYTNYVQVGTANQGDSDSTPGNDSTDEDDDDSVTPVPVPLIDLELDKSINDLTPNIGSNITFTINITNNGPSTATNVTVTDTVPSGYTFVSASATEGSYSNATALWTGLELAAGESQGLSIVATVNPAGDYTNYAEVETATENDVDSTPGDDSTDQDDDDSVTPSPVPVADLSLSKNVTPTTVIANGTVTFTLNITNAGPSVANNVVVTDVLPSGFSFVSAVPSEGSYDDATGGWSGLTLAATEVQTLTIVATANASGDHTNYAQVGSSDEGDIDSTPGDDSTSDDDDDTATVTLLEYDLALIKEAVTTGPFIVGDQITFTISISNQGDIDSGNFTVVDTLPAELTYLSASPAPASAPTVGQTGSVTWTDSALAAGDLTTYTITVAVGSLPTTTIKNIAEITVDSGVDSDSDPTDGSGATDTIDDSVLNDNDPGDEDDSDFEEVDIVEYDLALIKETVSPAPFVVGDQITFTLSISNQGDFDSGNFTVVDTLPAELTYLSASPAPGAAPTVGQSGTITWTDSALAAGDLTTYTVVVEVDSLPTGPIKNIAEITADSGIDTDSDPTDGSGATDTYDDPDLNDNDLGDEDDSDFEMITVSEYDLALIKETVTPGPYAVGQAISFTISISNQGDIDSGDFTVVDTLPAELTYLSASPAPAVAPTVGQSGIITWTDSALAAGALTTYTVSVEIGSLPTTTIKNIAEIVSDSGPDQDSDPTDGSGATDTYDDPDLNDNDPGDEDDSDFETLQVEEYDLALIKRLTTAGPYKVGDQITFDIVVMNQGETDSGNFTVEDSLPTELTFVSASPTPNGAPAIGNSGTITWTDSGLVTGLTMTYAVTVEIATLPSGIITNTAEITADSGPDDDSDPTDGSGNTDTFNDDDVTNDQDPGDEDDSDFETLQVEEYDLALIKSVTTPGPYKVGDTITMTLNVMNQGTIDSGSFEVTDPLPTELLYLSADPAPSSDPGTGSSGSVVWTTPNLSSGQITTYTLVAEIGSLPASGAITNTAEISSDSGVDDDSDPTDNSGNTDTFDDSDVTNDQDPGDEDDSDFASIMPVYEYDLSLVKRIVSPAPHARDFPITFQIVVMNQGDISSGDYTVVDNLPPQLTFVSANPAPTLDPGVGNSGMIQWSDTALAPGQTATYTLEALIASTEEQFLRNEAEITSDSGVDDDSDPEDGSGSLDSFDDDDETNDQDPGDEDDSDFEYFEVVIYDYGDLPDDYGTIENGTYITPALHVIDPSLSLGVDVNNEDDGQPGQNANDHVDDNGVTFLTPIMAGQPVDIEISANISGTAGLTATVGVWLDLNGDGTFTTEEFFTLVLSNPLDGANIVTGTLSFTAPEDISDEIYSRFRISFDEDEVNDSSDFTGIATSGEVEDYVLMSLGNTVFFDTGDGTTNDGVYDTGNGESGVSGVVLELYADGDVPNIDLPFALTTTDANGNYQFTGLPEGDYFVHIPTENFAVGAPLEEYASSTGATNDTGDENSNENGIDDLTPDINGISSGVITLSPGNNPNATLDGNTPNSDMTIDFGFIPFVPTAVELISFRAENLGDQRVKVSWETGSEVDNFGFRLYRSETNSFPSAAEIHFESSTVTSGPGARYQFTDTVPEFDTYYYWLVDVEVTGKETIHIPIRITIDRGWRLYLPLVLIK